ncbi:metallophosphoesterase [Paenibacillus sp. FSL H8-0548]|uniref:metallophosphoesterase n=1 Tax=Paenibacillus sp. FSL H8-0548 TaxID=1920422 RepID=UPI00096EF120|nr:metallophosphoesterase [Paenibacillus sp. FSL H8-0548]OMF22059.1 metallophosphoesterase [Paenibacillus sp. FSL H8-0548]
MEMRTRIHTIFMFIGSTECGKTTFANEVLMPQLRFREEEKGVIANVQYISSDSIRQELLGSDYDKYDQVMLEASDQAFQLLFEKLRLVTTYPINAEFVVVDTTGLSEDFRAKVRGIAKDNHYNLEVVLFDYRKREDYYASDRSKKLITSHINRLRKEVLGSLSREKYNKIHKVRAKDFYSPADRLVNKDYKIMIEDVDDYLAAILPLEQKAIIVGDVHECVDELKALLVSHGFELDGDQLLETAKVRDTKVLLVGDWIDKGKRTKEIIDFLYVNQHHFLFVLGNHESFVYKYMRGEIKGVEEELLHAYFDSTEVLRGDDMLLQRFNHLVSLSNPFYKRVGKHGSSYYVTHAPCENKYIGKLDSDSKRHQRNFRIDRSAPLEEQLAFLKREAVANQPYHVFGHIAAKNAFRIKNKIHIDSGAVHGNQLTSVMLSAKPIYKSQLSAQAAIGDELYTLFKQERKVSLQELDEDEARRLQYCASHKINYISGTMAPADKDEAAGELESLSKGLDYFRGRGVKEVVLQPKYMGSRCNVYLHAELDQCFAVSRNGYEINKLDLTPVYEKLLNRFGGYMKENDIAMLLLDGELLPWQALGEGLIDKQFKPIEQALKTELAFLQANGFDEAFNKLVDNYKESGFERDQFHLSKGELNEKHGLTIYQNYKHVHTMLEKHRPLDEHIEAYVTYKKQLELYAEAGELQYKPFSLLKMIYRDGSEALPDWCTSEMYRFLSDDSFIKLDLMNTESYDQAEQYFRALTIDNHMEGVVIKPEQIVPEAVPYMKVRNASYMSIIYGYDYRFPHKYQKLIKQKSINMKLRTSINEHRLGQIMLEVPFSNISPENEAYQSAVANLLFEVAREKEIDPRL